MTYEYDVLNYPTTETLNTKGADGWKVYHVRPDSGGVPWFVYVMRQWPRVTLNDCGGTVSVRMVGQ